jgi:prophage maintenance system killer protein
MNKKQLTSLVHFCQGFLSANGYKLHQKREYPQDMSVRQTPNGQSILNMLINITHISTVVFQPTLIQNHFFDFDGLFYSF